MASRSYIRRHAVTDLRARGPLRALVAAGCAWEFAALVGKRTPTLCAITRTHRWLAPLIVGAIIVDLAIDPRPVVIVVTPENP
ncbi:MAG: hypothetical protein M3Y91_15430 [Actinomycetota bacterium]|nr:hypothetical protein [Actinomycetota bacterium]